MKIQIDSNEVEHSRLAQPQGLPQNKSQIQMQNIDQDDMYLQNRVMSEIPNQQQQYILEDSDLQNKGQTRQQIQLMDEELQQPIMSDAPKFQSQILSQGLIFAPEKQSQVESNSIQQLQNSKLVRSSLREFSLDIDELREEIFQQKIQKYYSNLLESSMKKLQILLTTHPQIEEECDFVYHKGSSISYFARQNLSNKGFFNQYGNYASYEKPLKVITMTANVLFDKLNKLYQKNKLDEKLVFQIEKQVLNNIDQFMQELMQDPKKQGIRQQMEEQKITNEMSYLFIGMYHSDCQPIETTKLLETFQLFVEKVELRKITEQEIKKIKLLISDKRKYVISLKQINDFFNGFWTSPTDFEYLVIPQQALNIEDRPQTKITLLLEKVAPEYRHISNKVWKERYVDIKEGNFIEIKPQKDPIVFGRVTKPNNVSVVAGLKFFVFSQEQKLVSRHQFLFKYTEDRKFKLKCTSTGNPTCLKIQMNQQYKLHEEMVFFIGRSQGFVVKSIYSGKKTFHQEEEDEGDIQIIDIFAKPKKPQQSLLEKRTTQNINQNINNLVLQKQLFDKQKIGDVENVTKLQQQLNQQLLLSQIEEDQFISNNTSEGPFIEIEGLGEADEKFKTDFGWQTKRFLSKEIGCILMGLNPECSLRFSNPEIQPRHAEIVYNEKKQEWLLTSPFSDAETYISLKTISQIRNEEDTKEFEIKEGMVIAVESNEFRISQIEREQPF